LGKKIIDFDDKIFQALPTIILQFCSDARVRNGYRMAERTLRHSMDIINKGVAESLAELIEIDGDVALTLNSFVPASMRKTFYSTSVTFTANKVMSVCCDCKVGTGKEARECFQCVHQELNHIVIACFYASLFMFDLTILELYAEVKVHHCCTQQPIDAPS
jgi:hypothetical protein